MKKEGKFCPRCGAPAHAGDAYCMRCGYRFQRKKSKKISLKTILIIAAIIVVAAIAAKFLFNKSVIPEGLLDVFKNLTSGVGSNSSG